MSTADTAEATRALRQLAAQYRQQLALELAEAREEARLSPEGAAPAPSLIQKIHRIAGSSLSFGYAELGLQLQHIEQALRDAETAGTPATETLAALAGLSLPADTPGLFGTAEPSESPLQTAKMDNVTAPAAAAEAPSDRGAPSPGPDGSTGSRALLLDPHGWLSSEAESVIQAFGFQTARAPTDGDCGGYELIIEVTEAAGQTGTEIACRNLILVVAKDGFAKRLAAVRRGAKALLTVPLDLPSLERTLQSLVLAQEQRRHRVLLVDDDALLLERYRLALEAAGLEARTLSAPARLFELLDEFRPDVLVLDLNLPGCSGLELARAVRFTDAWLQMPVLFLSAQRSRQLETLTAAGEEFLSKPIPIELLVAQVVSRARRARALASGLSRDGLTGLLRQDDARQRLNAAVARAATRDRPLCAALIDLDHFKRVNDSFGHAAGDGVLRALANTLRSRLRGSDFAGRMGGEEFLVVLEDCSDTDALALLDRMRRDFAAVGFEASGALWHCTFSAGVALLQRGEPGSTLLERADQALYTAKSEGRNRCLLAPA